MPVFLFTDIEGSTEKWEKHRDAMGPVLARHDALLRTAVEEHGGRVVKTTGDGLHAVFLPESGLCDPLGAALAIQRAIQSEDWSARSGSTVRELRVRVGLHAGPAEAREGDWYGPAVNRAARVMAAAHGGQILVSQEVVNACLLPGGAALMPFGAHLLKDLEAPVHLIGIDHVDLRLRDFPTLKTLTSRPHNLPAQPTPFIGREDELKAITALLTNPNCRLLTLLGPGGIGKTRLALQATAEVSGDAFPDGVWFVPLAALEDPTAVPGAIVTSLGLERESDQESETRLCEYFRSRRMLLVLDNFEHLLPASGSVARMLAAAPQLAILVTSRERLGMAGETVWPVPGLVMRESLAESGPVRLFRQAALRANPAMKLDGDELQAAVDICRLTGGMPLAIEMAAAWGRIMSVREIASELAHGGDLLTASDRSLPSRQRSIRLVLEWTWGRLGEQERALFMALSVFRDGWTLAGARGAAKATPMSLSTLADLALIRRGVDGRYEVHELMRQFAEEQAKVAGLDIAARREHAEYYSIWLASLNDLLNGPTQIDLLHQIDAEARNLLSAWRRSVLAGWFDVVDRMLDMWAQYLTIRNFLREGLAEFGGAEVAVRHAKRAIPRLRVLSGKLMVSMARFATETADHALAQEHVTAGIRELDAAGDFRELANAHNACAEVAWHRADWQSMERHSQEAARLLHPQEHRREWLFARISEGNALWLLGRLDLARSTTEAALAGARALGHSLTIARVALLLGTILNRLGLHEDGRVLREESKSILRLHGSPRLLAWAFEQDGHVLRSQGDLTGARRSYEECERLRREIGDRSGIAYSLTIQASLAEGQREFVRAESLLRAALNLYEEMVLGARIRQVRHDIARLAASQGRWNDALIIYREVCESARLAGDQISEQIALRGMTETAFHGGDEQSAAAYLNKSLTILARGIKEKASGVVIHADESVFMLERLVPIAEKIGQTEIVRAAFQQCVEQLTNQGHGASQALGIAHRYNAHFAALQKDWTGARDGFSRSQEVFRTLHDLWGEADTLNLRAYNEWRNDDSTAAMASYREALAIALRADRESVVLESLCGYTIAGGELKMISLRRALVPFLRQPPPDRIGMDRMLEKLLASVGHFVNSDPPIVGGIALLARKVLTSNDLKMRRNAAVVRTPKRRQSRKPRGR